MTAPDANRLGGETSPYLLQHKDNPVHWWPWCDAAFAAAARDNKPVLLSVGYAACHWCHVMAHESFENHAIAEQMNRQFVCIKVDREERPDIDAIYMKALHLLGEHGGWPLTMFLTPDRRPIWGGTYFPPEPRYGRPSFPQVLDHIARVWRDSPGDVDKQGRGLVAALDDHEQHRLRDGLSLTMLNDAADSLLEHVDMTHGGLNGTPKFPMPFVWQLVWRAYLRTGDARFKDAVTTTLDRMCQGGIYDHLAGGFARYSTDERWLAPHFEKMLYDNALLLELMADVARELPSQRLTARAEETVAWLTREMTGENGAFTAALDADSEGEEGKFYVWTKAEIDEVLGADAAVFAAAYDVTADGNWEGHTILNRNASRTTTFSEDDERRLASARATLMARRERRIRPGRDDKVLADWNGMAIAALIAAAGAFDRPAWLQKARDIFDAILRTMTWTDSEGRTRLSHSLCGGRAQRVDLLDDYAHMIRAALALFEATGDEKYLTRAETWAAVVEALFADSARGGYYFSPSGAGDLIVRTRTAHDSATPSGNGVMAANLARLFYLTGREDARRRAERTISAFEVDAIKSFPHAATILNAFELLVGAVQVAIVAEPTDAGLAKLRSVTARTAQPNLVVLVARPDHALPDGHPAADKTRVGGKATAYVCRGQSCSAPVTTADDLAAALRLRSPPVFSFGARQ